MFPPSARIIATLNTREFPREFLPGWDTPVVYGDRGVYLLMETVTDFALCPKRYISFVTALFSQPLSSEPNHTIEN